MAQEKGAAPAQPYEASRVPTDVESLLKLSEDGQEEGNGPRGPQVTLDVYGGHVFETDLTDDDGSMSLSLTGANLSVLFPINERHSIGVGFKAEQLWYEFSDLNFSNAALGPVPVDELWDDVRSFELSVSWMHQIDESWSVFASGQVQSAGEDGAEFGDTLTFGGLGAFNYKFSDSLELGAGIVVTTRLEDDATILPIPSVRWQINEKWLLTTDVDIDLDSVGLKLSYQLTESVSLGLKGGFSSREFRLSEDNAARNGIGRHEGLPVRLSVDWQFAPRGKLWVSGGYMFGQQLELDAENGDEIGDFDVDGAPMFGAGLSWEF